MLLEHSERRIDVPDVHSRRESLHTHSQEASAIEKIVKEFVKKNLESSDIHGYEHTMRVYHLAVKIAHSCLRRGIEVNMLALKLAALLHDIGRPIEKEAGKHHALLSAEIARKLLTELRLESELVERVCEAIKSHSFSLGTRPISIEAKILSDADKLDAIGAIGISRCFMLAGATNRSIPDTIKHFHEKLLKLKGMLFTDLAKEIAEKRHNFMEKFLKRLKEELRESGMNPLST